MTIKLKKLNNKGFTLPEIMIATLILLPIFVTVMLVYIKCIEISDMARNSSNAVWLAKNKMAEIENTLFTNVSTNYDNATFNSNVIDGVGISYVDSSQPDILQVTISYCWQEKNGRIIGEDLDLDGVIDVGEDVNNNGVLDSPVMITTNIYNT